MKLSHTRSVLQARCLRLLPLNTAVTRFSSTHTGGDAHPSLPPSFIALAARDGVASLLHTQISSGRFDSALPGLTVTALGAGTATCEITVTPPVSNAYGTLHGGAAATLVDIVSTLALLTLDSSRAGVSLELGVAFLSPAPLGSVLQVDAEVSKCGKRVGFTDTRISIKGSPSKVVVQGRHTKMM